jgi:DNA-directed RNA polymerase subunit M/transcription elongation factor TFIIS
MRCPKCGDVIRPQDTDPGNDTAHCKNCGVKLPFRETFIETTELHCLKCAAVIPPENINIETYTAQCKTCGEAFPLLDIIEAEEVKGFLENPPDGTWFEKTTDGFTLGASTRSSGAVPMFILFALLSAAALLVPVALAWHEAELSPRVIIVAVFFLAITVILLVTAVSIICGRLVVEVKGDSGVVFAGLGPFSRRKNFKWSDVTGFRQEDARRHGPSYFDIRMVAKGNSELEFGGMLDGRRRLYLLGVLRKMLSERDTKK